MKTKTAIMYGVATVGIIMLVNDYHNTTIGFMIGAAYCIIGIIGYALCRSAKGGQNQNA